VVSRCASLSVSRSFSAGRRTMSSTVPTCAGERRISPIPASSVDRLRCIPRRSRSAEPVVNR
jgi:hypothetical protein